VRRLSQVLFGHTYRLELIAALATQGRRGVCISDLAAFAGTNGSVFHPVVRRFVTEGLVSMQKEQDSRRVLYSPTESAVWDTLADLVNRWNVPVPRTEGVR